MFNIFQYGDTANSFIYCFVILFIAFLFFLPIILLRKRNEVDKNGTQDDK